MQQVCKKEYSLPQILHVVVKDFSSFCSGGIEIESGIYFFRIIREMRNGAFACVTIGRPISETPEFTIANGVVA